MNKKVLLGLAMCLLLSNHCLSASFDCEKTLSKVETEICRDKNLSDLDSSLALIYKYAVSYSSDSRRVVAEQREWIVDVRNKCIDADCINGAYKERIKKINKSSFDDQVKFTSNECNANTYKLERGFCAEGGSSQMAECMRSELKILNEKLGYISSALSIEIGNIHGEQSRLTFLNSQNEWSRFIKYECSIFSTTSSAPEYTTNHCLANHAKRRLCELTETKNNLI